MFVMRCDGWTPRDWSLRAQPASKKRTAVASKSKRPVKVDLCLTRALGLVSSCQWYALLLQKRKTQQQSSDDDEDNEENEEEVVSPALSLLCVLLPYQPLLLRQPPPAAAMTSS